MQERAREFSGDLEIRTSAGEGSTVTVTLPRSHQAEVAPAVTDF
jgi:nitrate/nitrite-specific signal transduction histidine kinase